MSDSVAGVEEDVDEEGEEDFGNGNINCGCFLATSEIFLKTEVGMLAHNVVGLAAWRRRHSASISLGGRAETLDRSRKEESVFMAGFDVDGGVKSEGVEFDDDEIVSVDADVVDSAGDTGDGGGGGLNGICESGSWVSRRVCSILPE